MWSLWLPVQECLARPWQDKYIGPCEGRGGACASPPHSAACRPQDPGCIGRLDWTVSITATQLTVKLLDSMMMWGSFAGNGGHGGIFFLTKKQPSAFG